MHAHCVISESGREERGQRPEGGEPSRGRIRRRLLSPFPASSSSLARAIFSGRRCCRGLCVIARCAAVSYFSRSRGFGLSIALSCAWILRGGGGGKGVCFGAVNGLRGEWR